MKIGGARVPEAWALRLVNLLAAVGLLLLLPCEYWGGKGDCHIGPLSASCSNQFRSLIPGLQAALEPVVERGFLLSLGLLITAIWPRRGVALHGQIALAALLLAALAGVPDSPFDDSVALLVTRDLSGLAIFNAVGLLLWRRHIRATRPLPVAKALTGRRQR